MNSRIDTYLGSNITLVLDSLDLARVSRDKIRASVSQAAMMDTPDLLVVMAPPGIVVQIAEKRIIVGDQTQSAPGQVDVWSPAATAFAAANEPKLVAFGFNYNVGVVLEDVTEAAAHLTRLFLPTADTLQALLQVQNLSAVPRLVYSRDSIRYDLRLEPVEGPKIKVHLNAHFAGRPLPDLAGLRQSFIAQFDEVGRILGAL